MTPMLRRTIQCWCLILSASPKRRGSGSGGTSGDEGGGAPEREDSMFAIERCVHIEGVGAVVRVGASEGEGPLW